MKRILILCLLAGCAQVPAPGGETPQGTEAETASADTDGTSPTRPRLRPDAAAETSVAQPDAEPARAAAPQTATTLVSLGDVTEPGLWIKTPLVDVTGQGQARSASTGRTASVTLIPIEGPRTAGSRASLQAMQALGLSLTDIAEVEVSAL